MFLFIRNKGNQGFRAGFDTSTTGCTLLLVHNSNAIHYMNGIKCTGLYAGTIATTRVWASLFRSPGNHSQVITICNSCIAGNLLCFRARSLAMYMGNLFFLVHGHLSCSQDCRNLLRHRASSHRTLGYGSFSQCHSLGTSVTTGESAGTAVISRKRCTNLRLCFVHLHFKLLGGYS